MVNTQRYKRSLIFSTELQIYIETQNTLARDSKSSLENVIIYYIIQYIFYSVYRYTRGLC